LSKIHEGTYKDLYPHMAFAAIYLLLIILYLFRNVYPRGYFTSGSYPEDLFIQDFFNQPEEEINLMYLYASEARNYQKRIENNAGINDDRAQCLKISIVLDCILPIILLILFVIF